MLIEPVEVGEFGVYHISGYALRFELFEANRVLQCIFEVLRCENGLDFSSRAYSFNEKQSGQVRRKGERMVFIHDNDVCLGRPPVVTVNNLSVPNSQPPR